MLERHFVIYKNEHTEKRHGQNEMIQTMRVEEIMADGKRKTVYSDIRLYNGSIPPELCSVFKKVVPKKSERRGWRSGRRAA